MVENAFELIGKKWTGLIIHVLGTRTYRFSDLLREIADLSPRMLTERLKELEEHGIVKRDVLATMPVQVEYSLTEKGRELVPLTRGIAEWAHVWERR